MEPEPEMEKGVTVYNDGEIAVQAIVWSDDALSFGSVLRRLGPHEQATREKFLEDLPVNTELVASAPKGLIEAGIAEELRSRGRSVATR